MEIRVLEKKTLIDIFIELYIQLYKKVITKKYFVPKY